MSIAYFPGPSYDENKLPLLQKAAEQPEVLVPIRLDLEIENHKLRDTFLWNKNGTANLLCSVHLRPLFLCTFNGYLVLLLGTSITSFNTLRQFSQVWL